MLIRELLGHPDKTPLYSVASPDGCSLVLVVSGLTLSLDHALSEAWGQVFWIGLSEARCWLLQGFNYQDQDFRCVKLYTMS